MSQALMKECFEQSYAQKWEQADEQYKAIWETAWYASRATMVIWVDGVACLDSIGGDVLDAIEAAGVKWELKP